MGQCAAFSQDGGNRNPGAEYIDKERGVSAMAESKTYVLTHGDGIRIDVAISDLHYVDREGIENEVFTPYAALDPGAGVVKREDGSIGIGLGAESDVAIRFARHEARVRLLHKLMNGKEVPDKEWGSVYVFWKTASTGSRFGRIVVRISDMFWHDSSERFYDFPHYLEDRFNLDGKAAVRLAWSLVRAAYVSEWGLIDRLIREADEARVPLRKDATKEEKTSRTKRKSIFESSLATAIETLKQYNVP